MEYKHKIHIPSTQKENTYQIAQCVKCDCDIINIEDYEDNYGPISTATCTNKSCNRKIQMNVGIPTIIKEWNKQNDISILIADKTQLIYDTKNEILDLKKKQKSRLKKVRTK